MSRAARKPLELPDPAANPHLFGQEEALARWRRAWRAGRLAHAWLLSGPRGVGKTTLACRLARLWLSGDPEHAAEADPTTPLFRQVASGAHPDFHRLAPRHKGIVRGRRAELSAEEVRDKLALLQQTGLSGHRRVCLIEDAEAALNEEGENALLKLLEEPPPGLLFLIVVQRPGLLPPTIASRCVGLRLRPLGEDAMRRAVAALAADLSGDPSFPALLELAEGSPGRLLEAAASGWLEAYAALADALAREGLAARLAAAELLAERARQEGVPATAELLGALLRRAARVAAGRPPAIELVPGEAAMLRRLAQALGLDRALAMWDKLGALAASVEGLNLDPLQALLPLVSSLGGAAAPARERAPS
ncbi:MAG: hypothetical protein NZ555_14180 [Geminicoccaceae bacterium]|nr:hypothetical protein [Geminicoccaceae bacterium]MCX8102410.1 hypothetical protein [Geminicoccaceae bacterium]MDW8371258.1 hypothetical protein [Geminicoccaceae bacterium]